MPINMAIGRLSGIPNGIDGVSTDGIDAPCASGGALQPNAGVPAPPPPPPLPMPLPLPLWPVAADRVPSDEGSAITDGTAATADISRGGARTTFRFLDAVRGGLDERESVRAGCLGVARRRFFALTVPASLPAGPGRLCGGLAFCDVPGVRPDRRASCRVLASVC